MGVGPLHFLEARRPLVELASTSYEGAGVVGPDRDLGQSHPSRSRALGKAALKTICRL